MNGLEELIAVISKVITIPCYCDNCIGATRYFDEERIKKLLADSDVDAEKYSSLNHPLIARFETNVDNSFNNNCVLDAYYNVACKNKGWFRCNSCNCCLGIKKLANKSALINSSAPLYCYECIDKMVKQIRENKKLGLI